MNPLATMRIGFLITLMGLILMGCSSNRAETESLPTTDPNTVSDIVWEWEILKVQTGWDNDAQRPIQEITTIPNPENYTLILRADGTFSGRADCNQISGTYSTENGYFFTLGPATMAACSEESLDQQYVQLLGNVVTGGPYGSGFALETAGGAERMEFRNGGDAPAQ
jgi:heat shock protein HslJ